MEAKKMKAGRKVESPSGQKRVAASLTIDPVYKEVWGSHGDCSLSQLIEWAIHTRLSATVKIPSLKPNLPSPLSDAERSANYRARKSQQISE